ncbi:MAG: M23 family metallopeptidase [Lachnospiraceae bacterium]|nr:M23 family metallopeptidase [Lachnospiraceae bacterium]
MRRDKYHKNLKKERIVMGASAIFVLAALTMTGVYVKNKGAEEQNDGYEMDYEALEPSKEEIESLFPTFPSNDTAGLGDDALLDSLVAEDALDYAPDYEETDAINILIPGLTDVDPELKADEAAMEADAQAEVGTPEETEPIVVAEEPVLTTGEEMQATTGEVQPEPVPTIPASSFVAGEALSWPLSGTVLISYSMDKTVFFATLQQYKYNPGMVISASVGDTITSAAAGVVEEIGQDAELGQYVVVDIGNGYKATYGQLQNIAVVKDGVVEVGSVLGYVAEPTKYYSVEGPNAYFGLSKDGEPVDPLAPLW